MFIICDLLLAHPVLSTSIITWLNHSWTQHNVTDMQQSPLYAESLIKLSGGFFWPNQLLWEISLIQESLTWDDSIIKWLTNPKSSFQIILFRIYRKTVWGKSAENKRNLFQKYSHAYVDREGLPQGSVYRSRLWGTICRQQVYLRECGILQSCSQSSF